MKDAFKKSKPAPKGRQETPDNKRDKSEAVSGKEPIDEISIKERYEILKKKMEEDLEERRKKLEKKKAEREKRDKILKTRIEERAKDNQREPTPDKKAKSQ